MKRLLSLAVIVVAGSVAVSALGVTVTLTVDPNLPPGSTPFVLGAINPDHPASPSAEVAAINGILGLPLGGTGTSGANTIYRSLNNFGSLPAATLTGSVGGSSTSFVDTGFDYLAAKYDGPNGATEVWYLGSIAAGTTITIPANAFGTGNNQYGLSGWNFFNPTTNPPSLPDGGSTVALLGLTLAGAGVMRRKVQS